jgi:hypothetical protein
VVRRKPSIKLNDNDDIVMMIGILKNRRNKKIIWLRAKLIKCLYMKLPTSRSGCDSIYCYYIPSLDCRLAEFPDCSLS